MFNQSDLIFLFTLILILAVSYYFMVIKKSTVIRKEVYQGTNDTQQQMGQQESKQKTRAQQIKEEKRREKKEAQRQELLRIRRLQEEQLRRQEEQEEKERQIEQKEEEKERKIKEEQEKKEQEEYDKWKKFLTLEEQGNDLDNENDQENLLQNFIDYIKLKKITEVQELALTFKLTHKDTLQRLKDLEENKMIQGVLDDRGKYIYIDKNEIDDIKNIIQKKGKLNRYEMVEEFSKIIRLEPTKEDLEKLKKYGNQYNKEIEREFKELQEEDKK